MSEDAATQWIDVIWSPDARAGLRAIDRYLANRVGDVKRLKPPQTGFRLRCGDYLVFFDQKDEDTMETTGVKNRREAYR